MTVSQGSFVYEHERVWIFRWPIKIRAPGKPGYSKRFLEAVRTRVPTHRELWEICDVLPRGVFLRRSSLDPSQFLFSLKTGVCLDRPDLVLSLTAKRELRERRRARWGRVASTETFRGERRRDVTIVRPKRI